jgi:hypothetical protein
MWAKVTLFGTVPSARSAHAATMLDRTLLVFGGCNEKRY